MTENGVRRIAPLSAFVFVAAGIKLVAHIATAARYGYHRDELYFIAAANKPDWGYVDFPPATPMVAKVARGLFGDSLLGLRLLPALAGVAVVILAALIARELGAGASGQSIAAVGVLGAPVILGINSLLSTATFDMFWWSLIVFLITRLLRTQEAKLWVAVGAAIGFAFLTKYTVLVLVVALAIAFVVTPERKWIGSRWVWIGVLLALGIAVPNLRWQQESNWPTLEYLQHQDSSATADSRVTFLVEQVLNPGPIAFILVVVGVVFLVRRSPTRVLGITILAAAGIFLLTEGKSYYTAALLPLAFAGAGVAVEGWVERHARPKTPRPVIGALALAALVPLPIAIPLLPESAVVRGELYELRSDYADMFGWEELAASVDRVVGALDASERERTAVVTANYGEAGAVDMFSRTVDEAFSGHNAYHLWGPPPADTATIVAVGFERSDLQAHCGSLRRAATIRNREGVKNIEYGRAIFVCRDLRGSVDDLWTDLKRYTA